MCSGSPDTSGSALTDEHSYEITKIMIEYSLTGSAGYVIDLFTGGNFFYFKRRYPADSPERIRTAGHGIKVHCLPTWLRGSERDILFFIREVKKMEFTCWFYDSPVGRFTIVDAYDDRLGPLLEQPTLFVTSLQVCLSGMSLRERFLLRLSFLHGLSLKTR